MDFINGLITGLFLGSIISFTLSTFIMASGKLNREHEAYRDGYTAGVNSVKNKEE